VKDLADMMAAVIAARGEGVFHLGTVDASEEIKFLRSLASEFGHDASLVVTGEALPTNANMVPVKILKMFGEEFRRTESDTLAAVGRVPELAPFRIKKPSPLDSKF
jgi:hypothetical protein